jgi:nucleolar protein 58
MLVLFETALGFCLFKFNEGKFSSENLWKEFESPERASAAYVSFRILPFVVPLSTSCLMSIPIYLLYYHAIISLKLKAIHRFSSTASAVENITAIQEGKMSKGLKHFLTDEIVNKGKGKDKLAVVDKTLGMLT